MIATDNAEYQMISAGGVNYFYDGASNPLCSASTDTSGNTLDLSYTYTDASGHNNGNVATIANNIDLDRTQSFSYDSLNRISSAWTAGTNQPAFNGDTDYLSECWAENYSYDAWGNLVSLGPSGSSSYTSCTQESGFNFTGAIGANNRIAAAGYGYDAAGNLTTNPGVGTQTFDAENHLVSAAGVTYGYDGDGKRVTKAPSTTPTQPNYIYWYGDTSSPVIETNGAGAFQYRYISFNGMRVSREEANDWVDHYGLDALGNARVVFASNGGSGGWDVSDFYPFGGERVVQSNSNNHYKFTGKERDSESGLDNFGARFDSSVLGRFMSPDSTAYSGLRNPQSWNLYAYTLNNPLRYADPTGHTVECKTNAADCLAAAQGAVGKEAAKQLGTKTTQSWWQKHVTGGSTTTLTINGDEKDFRSASGNASKLADLVDSKTNFEVSIQQNGEPRNSSIVDSIISGGAKYDLQGAAVTYTPSEGYLPAVFLDPRSAETVDTDAARDHIPPANIAEKFAHELLGHEWGEIFGGHPAGTAANKQDAINSENEVRRSDPSQGQKTRHHD